jgi:hypothetical protein
MEKKQAEKGTTKGKDLVYGSFDRLFDETNMGLARLYETIEHLSWPHKETSDSLCDFQAIPSAVLDDFEAKVNAVPVDNSQKFKDLRKAVQEIIARFRLVLRNVHYSDVRSFQDLGLTVCRDAMARMAEVDKSRFDSKALIAA